MQSAAARRLRKPLELYPRALPTPRYRSDRQFRAYQAALLSEPPVNQPDAHCPRRAAGRLPVAARPRVSLDRIPNLSNALPPDWAIIWRKRMNTPAPTSTEIVEHCKTLGFLAKQLYVIFTTPTSDIEPVMKNLEQHLDYQQLLE